MQRSIQSQARVREILEALKTTLPDHDPRVLTEFCQRLLARAPTERLEEAIPGQLGVEVANLFRLVEETPPGGVGVIVRRLPRGPHRTVVLTSMEDCAFIVETLQELVTSEGHAVQALLHPILAFERDDDGRVTAVLERSSKAPRTSAVLIVIEGYLAPDEEQTLAKQIRNSLEDVRVATRDHKAMLEAARAVVGDLEVSKTKDSPDEADLEEIQEFLEWLELGNFVFLGYRSYDIEEEGGGGRLVRVRRGSSLGILSDESSSKVYEAVAFEDLPPDLEARMAAGPTLMVSKTNALSPVHRRSRMDDISVKRSAADGGLLGADRFLGLFTAKAFSQDASSIPILRRKLTEILNLSQAEAGTHDYGLIVRVFNSLPKEDLFSARVSELVPVLDAIIETHGSDDVLLLTRADTLGRGVKVTVVMPRQRFSGEVRQRVQDLLVGAYDGHLLNYHLAMGEGGQARLHFHIAAEPEDVTRVDVGDVEDLVNEAVRSWDEKVRAALEEIMDLEQAVELADRYCGAFSPEYRATTSIATTVLDIRTLEDVRTGDRSRVTLMDLEPPEPDRYWLNAFDRGASYALSDVMPVLENFGFHVVRAEAHEIVVEGEERPFTIHSFLVGVPSDWNVDRTAAEPRVEEALQAVRSEWAENLAINRLILSAGFTWRQVAVLKAYGAYAFRIGAVSSRLGLRRAIGYPRAARLLFEIFQAQFDPTLEGDRDMAVLALADAFHEELKRVESIEDDRALRRMLNLIDATVRTNYFQQRLREDPKAPLALKFDCRRIEAMPEPRPRFEIWVNSARTEGAHLRMGDVARGGLRWSDRTEDFRVEVLGLVKTQQVKNAVIVPSGAKGAFVVSNPPVDRSRLREAGITSYRDFVSAMLDVTDNVVDGRVVHPADTVIRDGDDPYLVVAADKGTATLSDTANALSARYGFWMGDAFASGGSKGYDHKAMGITARGAWECVKRHFREMGKDIQTEEFTVAGIGDMSGDVFGNGMLLSRKIKLVAAFDHRNIFIDPNPDPETSWKERKRLFDQPSSGWTDYSADLISEGGGVWGRGEKMIALSPQARAVLGIEQSGLNGDALIQAILGAPVELLWNGGIGTYVRASDETDVDVADPGNDRVRVTASMLRARVIGEGGNLGLTQRARIEYANFGGRLNTDAIDNSAGVDTSDHEVNIKILLGTAVARGRISAEERDGLLEAVETDVGAAVLANSRTQSLAISLDMHRVRRSPAGFGDALLALERGKFLNRKLENLPTTEDLAERMEEGSQVLTRPELSVLLAYSKLYLKHHLLGSDVLDDPAFLDLSRSYFPPAIVQRAGDEALTVHRLRANIAATLLTNRLVDVMGGSGLIQLARETHRGAADVARAWYLAYRVAEAEDLVAGFLAMEGDVTAGVQAQWMLAVSEALAQSTRWLLANADLSGPLDDLISRYGGPVSELRDRLADLLPEPKRTQVGDRVVMRTADGMAQDLAWRLVCLEFLDGLLPVAALSREAAIDATEVGGVYFGLAADIDFPWLQDQLAGMAGADLWEQRAARALSIDLEAARRAIVRRLISLGLEEGGAGMAGALAEFRDRCAQGLGRIRDLVDELKSGGRPSLASLLVAVHAVSDQCEEWSHKKV